MVLLRPCQYKVFQVACARVAQMSQHETFLWRFPTFCLPSGGNKHKFLFVKWPNLRKVHFKFIVTARKRSLWHGNVFTRVCHSVHWGGGMHAMHAPHHTCPPCHTCHLPCMSPCHACPPAMHVPLPCTPHHHACPLPCTPPATHIPAMHAPHHTCPPTMYAPLPHNMVNEWAVRTLLECILVSVFNLSIAAVL